MALNLTIDVASGVGVDYLGVLDYTSLVVENSVEVAADTMDFTCVIQSNEIASPIEGQEVIFKDGSTREFAGIITKINKKFGPTRSIVLHQCQCKDYVYFLDRRLVNNTYSSQAAGQTIKDILTDLFNDSDSDIHYEFFKDNVTNIIDGPTLENFTFDKVRPSQAFDQIAQAAGFTWWIDFDKNVYFKAVNANVATQLSALTLDIDSDTTTYFEIEEECSINDIGKASILRDVVNISTSNQVDEFVGSQGSDHNGEVRKIFTLSRKPFGFIHVTSVKLATVAQKLKTEDVDGDIFDGTGASNEVFVFVSNDKSYVRFASANAVAAGDAVEVTYKYEIKDDIEGAINIAAVNEMKARTQGDGIHQFVFAQASGLRVTDIGQLDRIEEILLLRKSTVLIRGSFFSWLKGWEAGQVFVRKWDQVDTQKAMFVISVTKQILTPNDDPTLSDSVVLSQITYSNIPHGVAV